MIKVGIIGFGKMGKIRAEAAENYGNANVISVYDQDENCDFLEYSQAKSAEDIINNKDIDAVFICTPNFLNKNLTIANLNAGKHVFCEKPPAFTAWDVEEIIKAEKKSGKLLMYGFNHRHHGSIKHMINLLESGEYGKIIWIRGRYGKSVDSSFFETWRSKKDLAGGGILLDQGIHMLDLFLYLAGDFHEVKGYISNQYWNCDIEDNAFVLLKNRDSGIVASLHSTMTQWRHLFSLEVFMEKGYIVLNGLKTSSGTYGEEVLSVAKNRTTAPAATWEDEERITFHTDTSWRSEIMHFFESIRENKKIEIGNSADALKLMKLIDAIYEEGK
ncbi:MAG: Gfo/Idh/MocA family oxidoreductase [Spirochaetales bacterium]|nr:Gfo/Idh/MocA family oxidoreductase [Spirochaetales bacterium]